jgi:hypothetical protein
MMKFFIILVIILSAALAKAGAGGHGGGGLFCPNVKDNELLDLWEAEALNNFKIQRSQEPVETQVQNALKKLSNYDPDVAKEVGRLYGLAQTQRKNIKPGISIMPPPDARNGFIKTGCSLEGVASYHDSEETLYIDPLRLAALPLTDQAALWVHEAVYKFLRQNQFVADSISTRDLVGRLFSDRPAVELSRQAYSCVGDGAMVLVDFDPDNTALYFQRLPNWAPKKSSFSNSSNFMTTAVISFLPTQEAMAKINDPRVKNLGLALEREGKDDAGTRLDDDEPISTTLARIRNHTKKSIGPDLEAYVFISWEARNGILKLEIWQKYPDSGPWSKLVCSKIAK